MKKKDTKIAIRIRTEIKSIDPKAKVILFGSRARGDAQKDSDWDLLILIDSLDIREKEHLFRDKLYDLELETGEIISMFVYNNKDWSTRHKVTPLYINIKREGVVL
ncbi:MAG TPA: nucleotidyltransferase domain-containing protein [Candidatus Cloacimonadota bacterium]|jgi:predicted nucleotidyltransferase|nr:nucleotidyltransferase domain-containing protein [Candidatus Cloacimonadota bacterium]